MITRVMNNMTGARFQQKNTQNPQPNYIKKNLSYNAIKDTVSFGMLLKPSHKLEDKTRVLLKDLLNNMQKKELRLIECRIKDGRKLVLKTVSDTGLSRLVVSSKTEIKRFDMISSFMNVFVNNRHIGVSDGSKDNFSKSHVLNQEVYAYLEEAKKTLV